MVPVSSRELNFIPLAVMKSNYANPNQNCSVLLLLILFCFLGSGRIVAQTVNILGNPYGGNPYPSISAAIVASTDGDVILISGMHTESLSFSKNITLRGDDPVTDIIQAATSPGTGGTGSRVITVNPTSGNITIENLTIRHGNASVNGGGLFLDKVTGLVTLRNLIVTNNTTTTNGGGIAFAGSNALLLNSTVANNTSVLDGGGILAAPNNASLMSNVVTITQSLINANTGRNGGGIFINGNTTFGDNYKIDINIENSTISNNVASSQSIGLGGGSIYSNSSIWTTTAGGDGVSGNVTLKLVHATLYNNSHAAPAKNGIVFGPTAATYFSAYNSIIVNANNATNRAINFLNAVTSNVVNCILGGLENANTTFLDEPTRNNTRGRTAANAGLGTTPTLTSLGGRTQVFPIAEVGLFDGINWCTAATGISVPSVDQRGFTREGVADAGSYELLSSKWTSEQTWTPAAPDNLFTEAIIEAPYDSAVHGGGFFASKLTVTPTGSFILRSGHNIRITNEIVNNSNLGPDGFIVENNANLRQDNGLAINVGSIKVIRKSNPLMLLDYTLWSSPVENQNLLAFSPNTLPNRFYSYDSATNFYTQVTPSTTAFSIGKGYLIRMPNNHPTTQTTWDGIFIGKPNLGEINVSLSSNPDPNNRYNLVGNPYPSPIRITTFVNSNSGKITGTLWFWRKTNSTTNLTVYPTWNGGTFTGNNEPHGNPDPDPTVIRTGQGFFVQAVENPPGPLVFNNDMRFIAENTDQFFKNANLQETNENPEPSIEKHRIWLHLTNSSGTFYEQAISYINGGTAGADLYDAPSINSGSMLFNSLIANAPYQYVIQSRPLPFDVNDAVPLALQLANSGAYTISVHQKDGLFAEGTQAIYLKDNYTNTFFNLNQGAYAFNAVSGSFNDRFEIRFVDSTLSTPVVNSNQNDAVVYQDPQNQLVVEVYNSSIKAVSVYDLSGRLLLEGSPKNQSRFVMSLNALSNQVLLVQVENTDGVVVTKKIMR